MKLARMLKDEHYDLSISFFSEFRTALALYLARIPSRVGPATKLAQLFLNQKLRQKRSQSLKPEHEYNMDLVRFYVKIIGAEQVKSVSAPFLKFNKNEIFFEKKTNGAVKMMKIDAVRTFQKEG